MAHVLEPGPIFTSKGLILWNYESTKKVHLRVILGKGVFALPPSPARNRYSETSRNKGLNLKPSYVYS